MQRGDNRREEVGLGEKASKINEMEEKGQIKKPIKKIQSNSKLKNSTQCVVLLLKTNQWYQLLLKS